MTLEQLIEKNIADGMSETVAAAMAHFTIAENAERILKDRVDRAAREAADAVRKTFRDELDEAASLRYQAQTVVDQAKIESSGKDNRLGQKVTKKARSVRSVWAREESFDILYGTVEMRTPETRFPANDKYPPKMGSLFVRLHKKDGTPSLRYDESLHGWAIIEK